MIFNSKKRKQAVQDFFEYIKSDILPNETETEIVDVINRQLKSGIELIENNEWGVAFENLGSELVEHYVIIDRKGTELVKKIIKLCKLDKKWEFDLRRINSLGYKTGSWKLTDSEQLSKEHKYTFYKPSREITKNLKVGNIVKLTFEFDSSNSEHPSAERMWVEITEINGEKFKGKLDNHPFYLHELYAGDELVFEHKHIIDHDLEMSEPNLVDKYIRRCFVTNEILYDKAEIKHFYKESPLEKEENEEYEDSGWRFFTGEETQEYVDNIENFSYVSLGAVLSKDDSFVKLLDSEIEITYQKNGNGDFEVVEYN